MGIKITGLDAVRKRLQEVQRPEFMARLLDDKYQHLRCPDHHRSPKHKVNATKTSATVTYCCDKLKEMHQAKLRGGRVATAKQEPRVAEEAATLELPVELVVEGPAQT
jgi:hypothetical protein